MRRARKGKLPRKIDKVNLWFILVSRLGRMVLEDKPRNEIQKAMHRVERWREILFGEPAQLPIRLEWYETQRFPVVDCPQYGRMVKVDECATNVCRKFHGLEFSYVKCGEKNWRELPNRV